MTELRHGPVCRYCTFVWGPTCNAVFGADLALSFSALHDACVVNTGPAHLGKSQDDFVVCAGGCGKTEPVYQTNECGSRVRVNAFICPACHDRVCEVDTSEDLWHDCKAKELL